MLAFRGGTGPEGKGLALRLALAGEEIIIGSRDETRAKEAALEAGVTYHDGVVYSPDGVSGANCMRLCFGYNTPEEIHEGVARLAAVLDGLGMLRE